MQNEKVRERKTQGKNRNGEKKRFYMYVTTSRQGMESKMNLKFDE